MSIFFFATLLLRRVKQAEAISRPVFWRAPSTLYGVDVETAS